MKKIFYLFAALAVFAACDNGKKGTTPEEPTPDPTLTVSVTALEYVPEGEAKSFTVSANNAWTVTTEAAWLTINKPSGEAAENVLITVTAGANETGEKQTAEILVKSSTLTKKINVSQESQEEPEEPGTGGGNENTTQYQRSTDPIMYAAGLQDGKMYVMYCKAYDLSTDEPKCWSESEGKLTMKTVNSTIYSETEVFEYKYDASKSNQPYDNYGSYSAGAWKSVSTGKYLDEDFNLNAELEDAVWVEYANNWNNAGGNEINVLDVYKSPYTAGASQTIWYKGGESFEWGSNANPEGFTHFNRKWVAYEVSALQ